MPRKTVVHLAFPASSASLFAQESFPELWEQRTTQTPAKQPAWPPIIARCIATVVIRLLAAASAVYAQSNYAVVRGSILDPQRQPMAG